MTNQQKLFSALILTITAYLLFITTRYWYADTLYANARNLNRSDDPTKAQKLLDATIKISPKEPLYHLELSEAYTRLALTSENTEFILKAIEESEIAIALSPSNVNLRRSEFSMFIRLALIDPNYLLPAVSVLEEAVKMAGTDAKLFYNLGLTYARTGQLEKAITLMQKTIELKPNYKDARLAYALLLIDRKENQKAKEELMYILEKIDPNDSITKQTLEEIQ
jgi:Tfp pilus assembly protein PilF